MKFWCKNLLAVGLGVALLSGCSSNDVDSEPVADLKSFKATVSPEINWSASVGDGVGDYYSRLRPAVDYGKIFVADREGKLVAFDEQSGEKLWDVNVQALFKDNQLSAEKDIRLAGGISAARSKVFVGGETGLLGALSADNGELVWHAQASGEILSAPVIGDNIVVVNTGAGSLDAFDVDTGEKRWSYEYALPSLTLRGTGSAAYQAGGFFVGTADGKVAVVIKDNGQPAWEQAIYTPKGGNEFSRMADVDMTPLPVGENLYAVSYNGNLAALEMRSGRVLWSRKYSSFNELAASGVQLYLVAANSHLYALDRRNGLELWSNTELTNRQLTSPAVVGNYLVVGDFEGYLHFINRDDGVIAGRVRVDSDGLYSQPLVVDGKIYVQGRSGKVARVVLP